MHSRWFDRVARWPPAAWAGAAFLISLGVLTGAAAVGHLGWPEVVLSPGFMAAGAAVLVYASRRRWGAAARDSLWVNLAALSMGVLAIPYLLWFAGRHPIDGDFYLAAAQVIPVLILALLVDVSGYTSGDRHGLLLVVIAAFLGEGVALTGGAAPDTAGSLAFALVSSSLVIQAFALVFSVMSRVGPSPGE